MKKFEEFLNKINFKKAAKVYVIVSVLVLILCAAAIGVVTRDKIKMAIEYNKVSEAFEKNGFNDKLKPELSKLAADSKDIINCIVVDKENNIVYKASDNLINNNNKFTLASQEPGKRYLQDNINKDVVYKVTREENIIFNKAYIEDHHKVLSDIDQEFYYEKDLKDQKVNLLNYIVNRETKEKLFIMRTATPIPYAEGIIEAIGTILGLIFVIYWIGIALWVYRDADRKKSNPALWGLLTLLTNLVGLIIYTMYKQTNKICYKCGAVQNKDNIFCSSCGTQINEKCKECNSIISKNQSYCSSCGHKL